MFGRPAVVSVSPIRPTLYHPLPAAAGCDTRRQTPPPLPSSIACGRGGGEAVGKLYQQGRRMGMIGGGLARARWRG